ncbi:hypothetical protein [Octadecabacter ascidiaceicola]|uniref:Uncharacterized protein n=1 Tax=Octadecabacter ascidiaceicola TaxID=1655543 RepID=A0A238K6A2_9RHOB|nr:hypothetical protein [Octadecabacter ascidiaceicola]SMX37974.1 hypothetical protein OCA8868_01629 [Octadecabacter ascidiaceicola]
MSVAQATMIAAFVMQALPVSSDNIQLSDILARPEPLTTLASDAPDSNVRCHSFFLAVNAIWAMSKPFGEVRDVFDWSFDRTLFADYDEEMRAQVQDTNYVGRYIETIAPDGINPELNSRHPVYLADKTFCAPFGDETS